MDNKNRMHWFALIGILATYAIAFGLDRWIQYSRERLSMLATGVDLLMWSYVLANIILAVCVLALYTWVMPYLSRWAVWIILIFGLVVNLIPVLYWLPFGLNLNIDPSFFSLFLANRAYASLVGGFTAIAGLITLLRRQRDPLIDD